MLDHRLPNPARYFPLERGEYEVGPGFHQFGKDFGNGSQDQKVFQLDALFPEFRENKLTSRAERLGKYFCVHELSPEIEAAACEFIATHLATDWPHLFSLEHFPSERVIHSALTDEFIVFDSSWSFLRALNSPADPPYASGLDALCCQIQEDVALTTRDHNRPEGWISALHLCSPSNWAPEKKIGKSFSAVHAPIPGATKMISAAPRIVDGSIKRGPYVRFAWGLETDTRLNHHPEPPPSIEPDSWKGRRFSSERLSPPFSLRLERQLIFGFPLLNASFFGIHVYFIDGNQILSDSRERELLRSALLSMPSESLEYKGLKDHMRSVLAWFDRD